MEKTTLLDVIGYTVENKIIDFLIEGRGLDYTKTDIANGCEISRPTLYKIWPRLEKAGIVKFTRKIGKIKLFTLNEANERVQYLLRLEEMLLKKSFEEVEKRRIAAKAYATHYR